LILLLIIFGSVTAASLPLAIGDWESGFVHGLRLLALVTGVSIFSVNSRRSWPGSGHRLRTLHGQPVREEIHRGGSTDEIIAERCQRLGAPCLFWRDGRRGAVRAAALSETFLRPWLRGMLTVALDSMQH